MQGLTLKHLRYFDALARQRHFGRAAEIVGISQPALSLQIKELESLFGTALVERSTRSIRLTPLGENLLERARRVLVAVDDIAELARTPTDQPSGRLRLGVIPTVAPYLLPDIMAAISMHFPQIDLQPREALTHSLLAGLETADLDLAIVALPVSAPSLQEFALFEESFVLVRHVRDADSPVPDPGLLAEMRLLLLEEGHCFRDQALSFCQIASNRPRALMEGSSLTTLVQMVSAGLGVTLIPEMAVPLETRSADVAVTAFPSPKPKRTIGIVWRRTNPLSQQFMQFGALVRGVGIPSGKSSD